MNSALGFWDLYKSSDSGKKVIETFDVIPVLEALEKKELTEGMLYNWLKDIFVFARSKAPELYPKSYKVNYTERFAAEVMAALNNIHGDLSMFDSEIPSRESFEKFVDSLYLSYTNKEGKEIVYVRQNKYREKSSYMQVISMALYFQSPFFLPMLLYGRFDIIQSSCARLGIVMPVLPHMSQYRDFLLYYYDLCKSIYDWRIEQELNEAEMCACLYDYAPRYNVASNKETELPNPTNIWFVGADKGDFKTIDNLEDPTPHIFLCNDRVLKGDIAVLYCRTPRKYIHSIWRANCDGIFNPFDNYTTRTFLVNGIRVPEITLDELHTHPYFKEKPYVRKNLQGIGRIEIPADDYDVLLDWIEQKGGDKSVLPKLYEGTWEDTFEIKLEHDVETQIVEKFLKDLGYEGKKIDWDTQVKYKKGRGQSEIPDYVVLPQGEELHIHSPLIIEVKKHMKTSKLRAENFSQAYSYARSIFAKYLAICDKVRFILYERNEEGCYDQSHPIFDEQWAKIYKDPATFAEIKKLIGKSVLAKKS